MTDYVRNNKTKRILTIGVAVLMVFSLVVPLITDPSYAAFTGKKGSKYNVWDGGQITYGSGNGGYSNSRKCDLDDDLGTRYSYCVQPSKASPGTGTVTVDIEKPELPDEAYALYDPQTNEIHVKERLDSDTKFFVIAREQAVAMLTQGEARSRDDVMPQAEFSAYLVTKRYGFNPPDIDFGRMAESFQGMEEKKVREELGGMRFTADRIHHKVQEQLELSKGHREAER